MLTERMRPALRGKGPLPSQSDLSMRYIQVNGAQAKQIYRVARQAAHSSYDTMACFVLYDDICPIFI